MGHRFYYYFVLAVLSVGLRRFEIELVSLGLMVAVHTLCLQNVIYINLFHEIIDIYQ